MTEVEFNRILLESILIVILQKERGISAETAKEILNEHYWNGEYNFSNPLLLK